MLRETLEAGIVAHVHAETLLSSWSDEGSEDFISDAAEKFMLDAVYAAVVFESVCGQMNYGGLRLY